MQIHSAVVRLLAALLLCQKALAVSWSFTDATLTVQSKGAGVGGGLKEKLDPNKPLSSHVKLGASDNLKIVLTTQEGKTAKRPHQAFLLLEHPNTRLDVSYPLGVKESGKAKLDLTHKDIPSALLRSNTPISASLVIASFGSSTGYNSEAFQLSIAVDASKPLSSPEKPLRYGKLPEIRHTFRPDPKSPNFVIVVFFTIAAVATVPILLGAWVYLGGNLEHLSKAFADAPLSHSLFVGSIVGIEFIFFRYYTIWNLFQTLPVLSGVGLVAYVSGSRALTEVQERRLAGLR